MSFVRLARAAAALGVAAFSIASGCSSDPPSAPAGICGVARSSLASCAEGAAGGSEPAACDAILAGGCSSLGAALSETAVSSTVDCLESGVCGVTACVTRAQKNAKPTDAHKALAASFCQVCAPDVADCEAQFYARTSKLPGLLVLPYAPGIAQAVTEACATSEGCRSTFVTCASDTIAAAIAGAVAADVGDCVIQAFQRDDAAAVGPGGGAQVARCTADNCAGCCRDDRCEEGGSSTSCGAGGAACETCSGVATCKAGTCKEPCGPDNCQGCCDGDTCVPGTAKDTCGSEGGACTSCTGTFVCSKGKCIDGSCRATCANGCCTAQGCMPGTAANVCGTGGESCVDCGVGRTCQVGACVLDRASLWDVYVSFADIPDKSRSNLPWDAFNGLPDPYLLAFASEGTATFSGKTGSDTDTTVPIWLETPLKGVKASTLLSNLAIEIWDEDTVDPDDYIGGCKLPVTTAMFDGSLQDSTCAPGASRGVSVRLLYRIKPHVP